MQSLRIIDTDEEPADYRLGCTAGGIVARMQRRRNVDSDAQPDYRFPSRRELGRARRHQPPCLLGAPKLCSALTLSRRSEPYAGWRLNRLRIAVFECCTKSLSEILRLLFTRHGGNRSVPITAEDPAAGHPV